MRLELNSKEHNLDQIGENVNTKKKELQSTIDSISKEITEIERLGNRNLAAYGESYAMVEAEIQNHKFNTNLTQIKFENYFKIMFQIKKNFRHNNRYNVFESHHQGVSTHP